MPEAQRFILSRVAEMNVTADVANHLGLLGFAAFFQKRFQLGREVEVVFDRAFAAAR